MTLYRRRRRRWLRRAALGYAIAGLAALLVLCGLALGVLLARGR